MIEMVLIFLFIAALLVISIFIEAFGNQNEFIAILDVIGIVCCIGGAIIFAFK